MDPLTFTEEQILAYVREGRFDAEIGVRLGISVAEVQRRTDAICRKLGVLDRTALKMLGPREASAVLVDRMPAGVPSLPGDSRTRRHKGAWLTAGASLVAAFVAAMVLAMLVFSNDHRNDAPAAPLEAISLANTPLPSPLPTWTPPAIPNQPVLSLDGVNAKVAVYKPQMSLPPDIELIYTAHDTTPERQVRLLRTYDRGKKHEVLYAPPPGYTFINAIAAQYGSDIVVAVCGNCPPAAGPAAVEFLRSRDAGITWVPAGTVPNIRSGDPAAPSYAWAVAFDGEHIIVAEQYLPEPVYLRLDTREIVGHPGDVLIPWRNGSFAAIQAGQPGRPVHFEGRALSLLPTNRESTIVSASHFEAEGLVTATWFDVSVSPNKSYLGVYTANGVTRSLTWLGQATSFTIAGWLDSVHAIGTAASGANFEPVIIRADTAEVFPLAAVPGRGEFEAIVAVRHGPAGTVKETNTPCLSMYERPDHSSPVVACPVAGVRLLASGLQRRVVNGRPFYAVSIGRFGPIGWIEPSALAFDDPSFTPERSARYGNLVAAVRPSAGASCANVHRFAGANEPLVTCVAAGTVVGHALTPLGLAPDHWYAVFHASNCYPTRGCLGEAIGFMAAAHLELQR